MTFLRNFLLAALLAAACSFAIVPSTAFACGTEGVCTGGTVCCDFTAAAGDERCAPSPSACTGATPVAGHVIADPAQGQPSPTADPANTTDTSHSGFANPLKAGSLTELLTAILHGIVQLGSILLVVALVWVGFQFVVAQGAEEKIRDARNALFWTVVGGLILLGAEAISIVIGSTVQAL